MTGKEAKTHIIDTINGDMVKEYFINEILPEILKALERLEELENDKLLDRAEKEELERVNKVLHHNLEEKVEIIFELENKIQDLEALKQRWQQEEWCEGIELSVESLGSLFKYNKDLFNKNLELDKKLEAEFEDSADAICKIANERDKLFDENIDLKFDLSALNEAKKIEVNYDEKLLKQIETLKQENQKLIKNSSNVALELIKLKNAIEIIKSKEVDITCFLYSNSYAFYNFYTIENELEPLSLQEFNLLKEVLENEKRTSNQ